MSHEFEVIEKILIFLSWILFEFTKLVLENTEMHSKLRLVMFTLAFDFVLQLCESVGLFIFVQIQGSSIFRCHQIDHLAVTTALPIQQRSRVIL